MKLLIRQLLYHPRHARPEEDRIEKMLVPSFFGILLCAVCMAGSTYAWFTAAAATPTQTIQAANYSVASAQLNGENLTLKVGENTPLMPNTDYTLTIQTEGSGSGYFTVTEGETVRYSAQIPPNAPLTFAFATGANGADLRVCWGTYAGYQEPDIQAVQNRS